MYHHRAIICLTFVAAILSPSEELLAQQPDPPVVAPGNQDPVVASENQEPVVVAARVRPRRSLLLSSRSSRSRRRLASTPAVFGDALLSPVLAVDTGSEFVTASLLTAGGSGRLKVAEQNRAIPVDRAFFHYQHYDEGANIRRSPGIGLPVAVIDSRNVDRFTVGFEKTFFCGQASIELRMPFTADIDYTSADLALDSGDVGNLSLIMKSMWLETNTYGVAYGMGIVAPTGGDVHGELAGIATTFEIENRAVNVVPFIGMVGAPSDRFFYHGFMQLDIPLNGNKITVFDGSMATDSMTDQTVFSFDLAAGYWLYRGCRHNHIQGLASMIELHTNHSTNDAEFVTLSAPTFGMRETTIENTNTTLGLHAELANNTALRFGWTLPLNESGQRFFKSEVAVSLQRHY